MKPTEQLHQILPTVMDLADQISLEQLNNPTPCDEFTVADVLDHMISLGGAFSYWFRGEEPPESAPERESGVPATTFRATMNALLAAAESPGALERTINAPVGQMPGDTFARLVAFDGLIHGWDLAKATGQAYAPPEEVVAAVDEFAREALTHEMRGEAFGPPQETGPSASRLDRLAAFSGRAI